MKCQNNLEKIPFLLSEWHPTRNLPLLPQAITCYSNKRVWWVCSVCKYEWITAVSNRYNGTRCPKCIGTVVTQENCLASTYPHLIKSWIIDKNLPLSLYNVKAKSNKRVWWSCETCKHIWQAPIYSRTSGHDCPACAGRVVTANNCFGNRRPNLCGEWDASNSKSIYEVTLHSRYKAKWICSKCSHKWSSTVDDRAKGKGGCGVCAGRIVTKATSFATIRPEIAIEWHPKKNRPITPCDVTPHGGNSHKFWWTCPKCKHDYTATLNNRSNGKGCPACAGQIVTTQNCLASRFPLISKEWDSDKNTLTPYEVTPKSDKKVWWKCPDPLCQHSWQATVKHRTNGTGCPKCLRGQRTSFPEQTLYFYFKKIFKETYNRFIFHDHKPRPVEADIYIPSLKLTIEYDGFYHDSKKASSDEQKNKYFHDNKIQLIRIRDIRSPKINKYGSLVITTELKNMSNQKLKELILNLSILIRNKLPLTEEQRVGLELTNSIDISEDFMHIIAQTKTNLLQRSLYSLYPDLVKEQWDYVKNHPLSPDRVSYGSGHKAWWICPTCRFSYLYRIDSKRRGFNGCPTCKEKSKQYL